MQDIMLLRCIYVIRRGLHATERRQLLAQAGVSQQYLPLPNDNLTQSSDLATQIKKNARDDYRVYHRVACAMRRGVSSIISTRPVQCLATLQNVLLLIRLLNAAFAVPSACL